MQQHYNLTLSRLDLFDLENALRLALLAPDTREDGNPDRTRQRERLTRLREAMQEAPKPIQLTPCPDLN